MTKEEFRSAIRLCERHGVDLSVLCEMQRSYEQQVDKGVKLFHESADLRTKIREYELERRICSNCRHEFEGVESTRCIPCLANVHSDKPNLESK